jgi:hypothetical protein
VNPATNFLVWTVVVVLALGALGIGALVFFVKRFKKRIEAVEKTPRTDVAKLGEGLHKATGTSVAIDKPIVSPLTQTECLFYHFKVEELQTSTTTGPMVNTGTARRRTQTRQSSWVTVISDKQAVGCGLQDETGTARVDLLGAEMLLTTGQPRQSSLFQGCPPELQETLKRRYDFSTKGLLLSKSLRYTEMVIRPGDRLFVLGDVHTVDGQPTFVKGQHSFLVSDKDEVEVLRHFRRHVKGCYVGMGIVAALTLAIAALPLHALSSQKAPNQPAAVAAKPQPAPRKPENKPPVQPAADRPEPQAAAPVQAAVFLPPRRAAPAQVPTSAPAPPAATAPPPPARTTVLPINTKVYIVSAASGRLLEADRPKNNKDGSSVVLRSQEGFDAPHRQWVIRRAAGTEYFTITNVESNRLLEGERLSSNRDGTKVQLNGTQLQGNKERLWQLISAGDGACYIVNVANGRYLDADESSLDRNATAVRLWGKAGEDRPQRKWTIVKVKP